MEEHGPAQDGVGPRPAVLQVTSSFCYRAPRAIAHFGTSDGCGPNKKQSASNLSRPLRGESDLIILILMYHSYTETRGVRRQQAGRCA